MDFEKEYEKVSANTQIQKVIQLLTQLTQMKTPTITLNKDFDFTVIKTQENELVVENETVMGVEEDSVGVVVELGGDILDEELNLVDGVGVALLSLEAGGLLGLLVK